MDEEEVQEAEEKDTSWHEILKDPKFKLSFEEKPIVLARHGVTPRQAPNRRIETIAGNHKVVAAR